MGKYSGVIIFSDFDGTFFSGKNQSASKENTDAVRYFQENGGRFTLATGRYPNILHRFSDKVDGVRTNAPIIAGNGCLVYDYQTEKTLFSANVTSALTPTIINILKSSNLFKCIDFFPTQNWASVRIAPDDFDGVKAVMNENPHKMYFNVNLDLCDRDEAIKKSDEAKAIIQKYTSDEYSVVRASIGGIEILPKDITKGIHVRGIAKELGCDKIICVGDYENDAAMIKEADIGYAMGNAHPSLFEIADRIAPKCEEHAIAKIISEL